MTEFLRIPLKIIDERRKAHLQRRLYNWWCDHGGKVGKTLWCIALGLVLYGVWVIVR